MRTHWAMFSVAVSEIFMDLCTRGRDQRHWPRTWKNILEDTTGQGLVLEDSKTDFWRDNPRFNSHNSQLEYTKRSTEEGQWNCTTRAENNNAF